MNNKSNYVFDKINLSKIKEIFNIVASIKNIKIPFSIKEESYIIEYYNNKLIIKHQDGREMTLFLSFYECLDDDLNYMEFLKECNIQLSIKFNEGTLVLKTSLLKMDAKEFVEANLDKVFFNYIYISNDGKELKFDDDINTFWYKNNIYNVKDGFIETKYNSNRVLISHDCEDIIKFNNKLIPDQEEIIKFNYENELKIINNFLNNNSKLHEFTLDFFKEYLEHLKSKEILKEEILGCYNNFLPELKNVIRSYNDFFNNLYLNLFTKKELEIFKTQLEEIIAISNKEYDEENNFIEEGIKEMLKDLDDERIKVLKKILRKNY